MKVYMSPLSDRPLPVRWWSVVLIVAPIVFLHFTLGYISGFAITFGFLGLILFVAGKMEVRTAAFTLAATWAAFLIFAAMQFVVLELAPSDFFEFGKTFLLVAFNLGVLVVSVCTRSRIDRNLLGGAAFWSLVVIVMLCLLQYISFKSLGSSLFFGLWGDFSYHHVIHPPVTQGMVRSYATYLEPSYCALVLVSMMTVAVITNYRVWFSIGLALIGIFCTGSLSGAVAAVVLLAAYFGVGSFRKAMLGGIAVCVMVGLLVLFATPDLVDYLGRRAVEAFVPGTSTYYRLIGPLEMVWDTICHYPLGRGLGMVEDVMYGYNIAHAGGKGSSLDNGWYLMVFYFGWCGVFVLLGVISIAARSLVRRDASVFVAVMFFLLSANFTGGGIFNAEYALVGLLVVSAARSSLCIHEPRNKNQCCDRDEGRLRRPSANLLQPPGRIAFRRG